MKMSFIREQDVGKRRKALNCLIYEVKPVTGIVGALIVAPIEFCRDAS